MLSFKQVFSILALGLGCVWGQVGQFSPDFLVNACDIPSPEEQAKLLDVLRPSNQPRDFGALARQASGSKAYRAALQLVACSQSSEAMAKVDRACFAEVFARFGDTGAGRLASTILNAGTYSISPSDQWKELDLRVQRASVAGLDPSFWDQFDSALRSETDASVVDKGVRVIATRMNDRSFHVQAERAYRQAQSLHNELTDFWEFAAQWLDVMNVVGKHEEALSLIKSLPYQRYPDEGKMRVHFGKAMAYRDLHRMDEAFRELDRVADLANLLNHRPMLEIVADLQKPGHSMDRGFQHQTDRQPGDGTRRMLTAASGAAMVVAGSWLWRRRLRP